MVDRKTEISDHFIHAGAGTALVVANVGALIPGFIPALALTALVALILIAPVLALGLAALLILTPPYALWRTVTRARRRAKQGRQTHGAGPLPIPGSVATPHPGGCLAKKDEWPCILHTSRPA